MKFHRLWTLLIIIVGITSCSVLEPQASLSLSNGYPILSSNDPTTVITIRNIGPQGTILDWVSSSTSELITVTPSVGSLAAGKQEDIVLTIDQKPLKKGEVLTEQVTISSSGGEQVIYVTFEKTVNGFEACGRYPTSFNATSLSTNAQATPGVYAQQKNQNRQNNLPYEPGRLLVKYVTPITSQNVSKDIQLESLRQQAREIEAAYDLQVAKRATLERPALVDVGHENLLDVAAALNADPRVAYAEPNYYLETFSLPNDEYLSEQWTVSNFGLEQAWEITTGDTGSDVVIAIIDSGVDMNHEDLRAKMLPGCDFYDGDNDPNPGTPNGGKSEHGTHVAGIAAAIGNNSAGIAGVAYGANIKILPVKVFDDSGYKATVDELIDAIYWSAGLSVDGVATNPNPADIINMSLGAGAQTIQALNDATQEVYEAGVLLFAATGNAAGVNFSDGVQSPANAPSVIAVGSVDDDFQRSSFSDYTENKAVVTLMAPGGYSGDTECGSVVSTFPDDDYDCLAGTSMAAPYAAGVAALLLSDYPWLTPDEVKEQLIDTAYYSSSYMTANKYGGGIVCADALLGALTRCGQ